MPDKDGGQRPRRSRAATTPEGRENQLVSLAMDLAEKRLRAGTATAQEVTHFLKLGSSREVLEQARIEHENELLQVKRDAIKSQESSEAMLTNALEAFVRYSGNQPAGYDD
jgi:hypothetical protein